MAMGMFDPYGYSSGTSGEWQYYEQVRRMEMERARSNMRLSEAYPPERQKDIAPPKSLNKKLLLLEDV